MTTAPRLLHANIRRSPYWKIHQTIPMRRAATCLTFYYTRWANASNPGRPRATRRSANDQVGILVKYAPT
jgi:hypothetical protein